MKFKIEVTEKAFNDINNIADNIKQISQSETIAKNFVNNIYDKIEVLADFPESGSNPKNRSLLVQGYKFLVYEQYLIFYKTVGETVVVAAVFNSKKDYFKYYKF